MTVSLTARSATALALATLGLTLAGCGGDSGAAASSAQTTAAQTSGAQASQPGNSPTASAATTGAAWNVSAVQDATWTAKLKKLRVEVKADDIGAAAKASYALQDLQKEMAEAAGPAGFAHITCVTAPIYFSSTITRQAAKANDDSESAAAGARLWIGGPLDDALPQGSGFGDYQYDENVTAECPALHAKILKTVQLDSLNQMFETAF